MKKLFIYFSLTGNGDKVAEVMKENGYDIRKVEEKHKPSKVFFFRVLGGGFRAGLGLKGKLINYIPDLTDYDEVVVGSPIWNGRFPPAINAVLNLTNFEGKKLSFVLYSGSGEGRKALQVINRNYPEAKYTFLKEPKSHLDELKKLKF